MPETPLSCLIKFSTFPHSHYAFIQPDRMDASKEYRPPQSDSAPRLFSFLRIMCIAVYKGNECSCYRKFDRVMVTLDVSSVSISVRWKECHLLCLSHLFCSLDLLLGVLQRQVETSEVQLV